MSGGVLKRKAVSIPLIILLLAAGTIWGLNYRYMKQEAFVFEVGQSIRGRLDDYTNDFKKGDPDVIASYFAEEFSGSDLGFQNRQKVQEEGGIVYEDWKPAPGERLNRDQMLEELYSYHHQLNHPEKTKWKMVFLNSYTRDTANILMRFQVYAHDEEGHPIEDRGHLDVDLIRENGEWKFTRQDFLEGRRALGVDSQYFVDVTEEAGIDFNTGYNEIFAQQPYNFQIVDRAAGGVTSGDYDSDGDPDLFFSGSEGGKLYRNTGDGKFEDVTAQARLDGEVTRYGQGCAFADYNNDGFLDLYITKTPNVTNRLLKNNGDGTFSDVTMEAGLELSSYSTTAGFADIENDGDLDLYVGIYGSALENSPDPPFHDRRGVPDRLYRNNGDGTFTDITAEADVGDPGWALGMTFLDYDNDGDQDIYVANDFGCNSLFQNDGTGHFTNVAKAAGALDYGFGMSASPGDYDNDGDLDIYVSNLYSGTTWYLQHTIMQFFWVRFMDPTRTWKTFQAGMECYKNLDGLGGIQAIGKKFGEGNSLLENQGDGTFKSIGKDKAVNMAGWAWASNFFDFDNDGDLDIHSVNGWISQKKGKPDL